MTDQFYRRDGTPYGDALEWARDFEALKNKRVAETTLPDGTWVSTVWLGLNHRFGSEGAPLIFETMAFKHASQLDDIWCERYSTEEEARAGHERIVKEQPWKGDT